MNDDREIKMLLLQSGHLLVGRVLTLSEHVSIRDGFCCQLQGDPKGGMTAQLIPWPLFGKPGQEIAYQQRHILHVVEPEASLLAAYLQAQTGIAIAPANLRVTTKQ